MGRSEDSRRLLWSLLFLTLLPCVLSIYCDEDDCYDLLGVTQASTTSDIKKAYYKLSLKLHPDKNPDPEAKKQFIKVANAYEILSDEAKREQYDYAIAHPEEVFYNTARYYQTYYGPQADLRAVLVGLLIILSGFQYLNQWTHYSQMVDMVKQTPAYKNKLKALELERNGSLSSKKKGFKPKTRGVDVEELSKELELQIQGAEKPTVWRLLGIRFILLPYTIGKLAIWQGRWIWRYWIQKLPYTWEDAAYLTKYHLPFPPEAWATLSEDGRDDLIRKRLWIRSNLDEFVAERKKESRESRRRRN
ncbi:DnaJ homolog subfamily C member 25 [Marchantia polymorpha subsp. ruderalis]